MQKRNKQKEIVAPKEMTENGIRTSQIIDDVIGKGILSPDGY